MSGWRGVDLAETKGTLGGRGKLYPLAARATAQWIVLPRVIGPARTPNGARRWRQKARRGRAELSGGLYVSPVLSLFLVVGGAG